MQVSVVLEANERYSALPLDGETVGWFLDDHNIQLTS